MAKNNKDKNSVETEEAFILRLPEVLVSCHFVINFIIIFLLQSLLIPSQTYNLYFYLNNKDTL